MFDSDFIEQTREAQGDEAAQKLMEANQREAHAARVERYRTSEDAKGKYPRMVEAIRSEQWELPVFADDTAAESFMASQEQFLAAMGAPEPGKKASPPPVEPQNTSEGQEPPEGTQALDPSLLGQTKGIIPWSEDATRGATLRPIAPGPTPSQSMAMVSDMEEMMDPQEGDFRRGRDRDFQLIKGMEIVNSMPGGTQEIRQMRTEHEDPDTFTI